jgi:hypothetical protein
VTTLHHASRAYAGSILAEMTEEQRQALDRFASRALDDPTATPADAAEAAALDAVDRLAQRGALRLLRGQRVPHQEAS